MSASWLPSLRESSSIGLLGLFPVSCCIDKTDSLYLIREPLPRICFYQMANLWGFQPIGYNDRLLPLLWFVGNRT